MNLLTFICLLSFVASAQAALRWKNHNQKAGDECKGCPEGKICIEKRTGCRYCHYTPKRTIVSCVQKTYFPLQCEGSQRIVCTRNKRKCKCHPW